ncbi:SMC-Scp complex subunit ScpB [Aminicella lysinilytica]|uniref:Segregation and condensation protein B n=1 Tax=Aminicella lysinilytica TaxID=433323 RepID=A0A4R6QE94_9FIRM|nr:SMC-Scp complex subunit ScpB [Aminicella lysinilytica]TDP60547.1 segregation and condensation protein B [Aminicella lysinilytica]
MTSKKVIKSAFESMLYVWGQLLPAGDAAEIFDISKDEAIEYFEELAAEYEQEGRGILIRRVNDSFQFVTRGDNEEFVRRLCTPVKIKKLSQAALEVLAIIAYRQPVTKGEIDSIRGIKCDRVIEGLMKKELIEDLGRSDAVGRPVLYGTTDAFLKNFGFESLKDLPEIENIEGIINVDDDTDDEVEDDSRQITIEMEGEDVRNN